MATKRKAGSGAIQFSVEDVNGSFAKFIKRAPKVMREELTAAIQRAAFIMSKRMEALAPDRSDFPPHLKDSIGIEGSGLSLRVGVINGDEPAALGSSTTMGEVALYNEYEPNRQPFIRPAAEEAESVLVREMTRALKAAERGLTGTGI